MSQKVRVEIDIVLYDEDDKVHNRKKKARGDNLNDDHKKMIKIRLMMYT